MCKKAAILAPITNRILSSFWIVLALYSGSTLWSGEEIAISEPEKLQVVKTDDHVFFISSERILTEGGHEKTRIWLTRATGSETDQVHSWLLPEEADMVGIAVTEHEEVLVTGRLQASSGYGWDRAFLMWFTREGELSSERYFVSGNIESVYLQTGANAIHLYLHQSLGPQVSRVYNLELGENGEILEMTGSSFETGMIGFQHDQPLTRLGGITVKARHLPGDVVLNLNALFAKHQNDVHRAGESHQSTLTVQPIGEPEECDPDPPNPDPPPIP